MMGRYLADMVFIVMAVMIAVLLSGMPKQMKGPVPSPAPGSLRVKIPPEVQSKEVEQNTDVKAIGDRNIFASSGSYSDNVQIPVPDNPYTLLGVVREGAGMRALFREYTGNVTKAAVGDRMVDGFRVAKASNRQVILKKGNERKVLNVYGASVFPASGPVDRKNPAGRKVVLIAILAGAEKKAVFKDPSGNLTILETRQSLPDGSVITHIDSRSVRLKHGKDEKELTLYAQTLEKDPRPAVQTAPTIQSLPQDKASPLRVPARRKPRPSHNSEGENDQGGVR